jgi:hypothetical protein
MAGKKNDAKHWGQSGHRADICRVFASETLNQLNGSSTTITDTLAPTDFASDNPFVTACSASSEPSVGMRICRYMQIRDNIERMRRDLARIF